MNAGKRNPNAKPGGELPYKSNAEVLGAEADANPIAGLNESKPVKGSSKVQK